LEERKMNLVSKLKSIFTIIFSIIEFQNKTTHEYILMFANVNSNTNGELIVILSKLKIVFGTYKNVGW
jgi:hypothetical protein